MFVYVYSVLVLGSGLAIGWSLIQGVLPTVLDSETELKRCFTDALCFNKKKKKEATGIQYNTIQYNTIVYCIHKRVSSLLSLSKEIGRLTSWIYSLCVPLSTSEPVGRYSRNLVWTLCQWGPLHHHVFF
jgi:hypothetical protein